MNSLLKYEIDLVHTLAYDSQPLEESSVAPKGIDGKWWVTTGIVVLGLIVGGAWKLKDELTKIDNHIARVETAVRIIGARQGGDTKTLIDEALTVAKKAQDEGHTDSARIILDMTNTLLSQQASARVEAPPEFFDKAVDQYQQLKQSPALADSVWKGTMALAEYRSAISRVPPSFNGVTIGQMGQKAGLRYLTDSRISGQSAIVMSPQCQGFDLDGWYLENVVFENARICYSGGPTVLQGVRFVNCQFDIQKSPKAEQLIGAVVKQPANIAIS